MLLIYNTCVSTYEIHSMHVACYGLVHDNRTICTFLHVTGVSTIELYQMHIACYRRLMLLVIMTVDKNVIVIVLTPRDFVYKVETSYSSRHRSLLLNLVSSLFCSHCNLFPSVLTYLVRVWVAQSAILCSCLPAAGIFDP